MQTIIEKPDAYGPFWVKNISALPLIALADCNHFDLHPRCDITHQQLDVLMALREKLVNSSFPRPCLFSHPLVTLHREYDFNSVVSIAAVVYSFLGCVPVALWFLFRQLEANTSLVSILCVYGYSLFVFIPASVIHPLPSVLCSSNPSPPPPPLPPPPPPDCLFGSLSHHRLDRALWSINDQRTISCS
jgi:hypothetical protein